MKNVKRKGFTLVELLIVIVIIGILAGAMMMLMGSSSDKAEATKIISDLRTMKAGVLQYYADNSGYPATATGDNVTALESYVDKELLRTTYDLQNDGTNVFVGRK
ncbi:MAG TPA: prepilin-type N-terminal cleavage/methylation domain-containing protein, partial [Synergistaceae bacterium]|nr:prepilin-type N-terminal cleavage/methylation domain-containing protein [Synergistaceae bacterium]